MTKRNNDSKSFKEWTTKKLKDYAKALHDSIYVFECFSTKDMMNLDGALIELENRGITPNNKLTF